jgi:hypothetical protein
MKKLPLFPELIEYINKFKWEEENYPKTASMKKYDKIELEFINDLFLEKYHREPTEEEIEEQKIELMKMKYLIETWIDEYFEKIEKEHELEKSQKPTKKA